VTLAKNIQAQLIALIREVAKSEIMPRFRSLAVDDVRSKTAPDDLVTLADLRSEAAISEGVRRLLPAAVVIGEEAVEDDPGLVSRIADAPLSVIIDPVDGTWNFAKGLATFGVILAVAEAGETVFGVLYDPVLDDWIWASKGGGAWYERPGTAPERLTLGGRAEGDVTGCLPLFNFDTDIRLRLAGEIPGFRRIWSVRCSCHEYRLMAGGRIDFTLSNALKPWDHAAGALAVAEAGGAIGLLDGRDYRASITKGGHLVTAGSAEMLDRVRTTFGPIIAGA
jgi:fructose-1,6-bisphosphatase/inositol monophosphatase family enzyme